MKSPAALATTTATPPNSAVLCLHHRSGDGCDIAPTRLASQRQAGVLASATATPAIRLTPMPDSRLVTMPLDRRSRGSGQVRHFRSLRAAAADRRRLER